MKRMTICFLLAVMVAGCSHVAPPMESMKRGCGPYPKQYETMLMDFLGNELYAVDALKDVSIIKPPMETTLDADYPFIPLFKGHAVWECYIVYNAKNRKGLYTGPTFHVAWIRNNRIVAFDYKEIDLEYAIKNRMQNRYQPEDKPGEAS